MQLINCKQLRTMKHQVTLFLIILFVGLATYAQDGKWSATLGYPMAIGNNFMAENYKGVVDLGLQYRFVEIGILNIGASVNGSYFPFTKKDFRNVDINAYFIQPRVFGELQSQLLKGFRPSLGLGYSLAIFSIGDDDPNVISGDDVREGGINLNAGVSFDFTRRFFAFFHYDFIKLNRDEDPSVEKFNTRINKLLLGVGYRF